LKHAFNILSVLGKRSGKPQVSGNHLLLTELLPTLIKVGIVVKKIDLGLNSISLKFET